MDNTGLWRLSWTPRRTPTCNSEFWPTGRTLSIDLRNRRLDLQLTATVTATAATNGIRQRTQTLALFMATWGYVRPDSIKSGRSEAGVRSVRSSPAGSHAGSHRDERPSGIPDEDEQRAGTRPRSRTVLNGFGCPHMELRIRRLGVRVPPSAPPKPHAEALPGRRHAAGIWRYPYNHPYSYRDASQL